MIERAGSALALLSVVFIFSGLFAAYTTFVHMPLQRRIWRKKK